MFKIIDTVMGANFSLHHCGFILLFSVFIACSADSDVANELTNIKSSSVAVINVSGKATIPTQFKIDGQLSSGVAQTIGSSTVASSYIPVEAGVRRLSIGSYQDSILIKESNYYTVMVYDNDSIQLSLDAPYTSNYFNVGPQIRWDIANENSASYRLDIKSDTLLLKDVLANSFTPILIEDQATLFLYQKGDDEVLKQVIVPTKLNRKETVYFTKNTSTNEFSVDIVSQYVKPQ